MAGKVKDLGEANIILGIHVKHDRMAGTISISQCAYLKQVLKCFGMTDCNSKATPSPLGITLSKDQGPKTPEDHALMVDKPYWEVLGSIMYAQIGTQPDLSYAVSTLSKYVELIFTARSEYKVSTSVIKWY